jgi:Zn-dependent metalloprotease
MIYSHKNGAVLAAAIFYILFTFTSITSAEAMVIPPPEKVRIETQSAVAQLLDRIHGTQIVGLQSVNHDPVRISTEDGYIRTLGAPSKQFFPIGNPVAGDRRAMARNFLAEHGPAFGIRSKAIDFTSKKSGQRENRRFERLQQTYGGIPVFGAEVVIQFNEFDGVEYVASDILRTTDTLDEGAVSTIPTIPADDAIALAMEWMTAQFLDLRLTGTDAQLMIYEPAVVGNSGPTRLVWQTGVSGGLPPIANEVVLIDAHSGEVVLHYSLLKDALNRTVYNAGNTTRNPGTLVQTEGGLTTGISDVDKCYLYFGLTYNFYWTEHGRDSIDNAGMTLSGTVLFCRDQCPYQNAYWDDISRRMYFGKDFVADDVTAHELTHGVTQYESNLIYLNESGAINESFSDMWGEWIDLTNGVGNDTPSVRWFIGEDLPTGAVRNMANPPDGNQPDRKNSPLWYTASDDYGGVHTNSGVGNKLCYLLTDGGTFNGQTITGLGISAVADLFYEVQTNLLTSGADYADLYDALRQAAINLGWSAANRENLQHACLATEVTAHKLTVNSSGASVVDIASSTGHGKLTNYTIRCIPHGTTVNLQAPYYTGSDPTRKRFTGWTGSIIDSNPSITFTMDDSKTIKAQYVSDPVYFSLTVESVGTSGVQIKSWTGHGGITNYTIPAVLSGTSVSVEAPSFIGSGASRLRFIGWTGTYNWDSNSVSFQILSNTKLIANYVADPAYPLTVKSSGSSDVTISSRTGHGGITDYTKEVSCGTSVTLEAPDIRGSGASMMRFTGWTGSVTDSNLSITFVMDGPKTVVANYILDPITCSLTVHSAGAEGVPISSDAGYGGITNYTIPAIVYSSYVCLHAPQYVGSGAQRMRFNGWTGSFPMNSQDSCFTMYADSTLIVQYVSDPEPDPISTVAQFQAFCRNPENFNKCYILTADLDCSGVVLTPVGISTTPYTGIFDGNGHVLSNVTIDQPGQDDVGVFGVVGPGGQIRDLSVNNVQITGHSRVGGLVGNHDQGSITRCSATGTVIGIGEAVGGLVGDNGGPISACYSTCSVTGSGVSIGGLAGHNGDRVTNCYATGPVTGTHPAGAVGGLVGENEGTLICCYATGFVGGPSLVGGLIGYSFASGFYSCCYWDLQTSGQTSGAGWGSWIGIQGNSTVLMQIRSTYYLAVWDFGSTWTICEGTNYPRLKWQISAADWFCPDGVALDELLYFAQRWKAITPETSGKADLDGNGKVNLKDLAIFSAQWLK